MSESSQQHQDTVFHVRQAFKLAISLTLFYALALWTNWDVPRYGSLAIVIVSLGTRGASIEQGLMRIAGTTAGVLIGVLILAMFNDSRWATMIALAANIALMSYCMQTSHYRYAWYAAAFIPLTVWADNYPHFDDTFYFTTFRWLETVVGVVIYTMVDLILWPRKAGDQLHNSGNGLLSSIHHQFVAYRNEKAVETNAKEVNKLRTDIAAQLSRTLSSLQNAYFDTPEIRRNRRTWESWCGDLQRLVESLEMWHESESDCGETPVERFVPGYRKTLDLVDSRLTRVAELWGDCFSDAAARESYDDGLLENPKTEVDRTALSDLPHLQRAALLSTVRQLEILNHTSHELLLTTGQLCGWERDSTSQERSPTWQPYRPPIWDTQRFINALYPVVTFVAAWLVWDLLNPPGGQKVAMLAGLVAIMVLRTPMNPFAVWFGMIVSTALVVAPICWLVMPALSTGYELLTMIFLLSFFFGCLGAKSPALKSGPLIQFFASAGISNQQSYSFEGPVNGSLMVLVGGGVVTVVYNLWADIRPEQSLLKSMRRTLHGCAEYCAGFDLKPSSWQVAETRHREHLMRSRIVPALEGMRKAVGSLDFSLYSRNRPEDWQGLVDDLESLIYRLRSFELAYQQLGPDAEESDPALASEGRRVLVTLSEILSTLSVLDSTSTADAKRQAPRDQLDKHVSGLTASLERLSVDDDEALVSTYTLLGNTRMVVRAVTATQTAIERVDCGEIATPRF